MGYLYHGSSESNIQRLEPRKSTHGTYVYATPYKELAIIFSARAGDDMTYTLYRNEENGCWNIVERIPEGFNAMFSNSSSIYTLDDSTFKDIHTGFAEVVSEVGVDTSSEERIDNVYDELKRLNQEGKIKLYMYPNRPKEMPFDNSDLIRKQLNQFKRNNSSITKNGFNRLILLHPDLINKVNEILIQNKVEDLFKKEDLIDLFENSVIMQSINPNREQYLKSSVIEISKLYPELLPILESKLSFLDQPKNVKISYLIDKISGMLVKPIPVGYIEQAKVHYLADERNFSQIGQEITDFAKKIKMADEIINKDINQDVLNNSILLIGPMGTGKSTISKQLHDEINLPRISLDDREQLKHIYKDRDKFKNFKEFEFYLTSTLLTSLKEPAIIDFGGGHSVYENPIMFDMMKHLMGKFRNVELLIPSENKEESLRIVNERMADRNGDGPHNAFATNKHFIESPCNYELATNIVHTKGLLPEEISKIIVEQINNKNDEFHHKI